MCESAFIVELMDCEINETVKTVLELVLKPSSRLLRHLQLFVNSGNEVEIRSTQIKSHTIYGFLLFWRQYHLISRLCVCTIKYSTSLHYPQEPS